MKGEGFAFFHWHSRMFPFVGDQFVERVRRSIWGDLQRRAHYRKLLKAGKSK